jgi:hypothetical protein
VRPADAGSGPSTCVQANGLSILRPIVRVVAAHLPLHLLQQIGGRPSDLRPTGTTRIAQGSPCCPRVGLPRLQRQRAAWTVGIEGWAIIRSRNTGMGGGVISAQTTVARMAIASFGFLSVPMTTVSGQAIRRWVLRHAARPCRSDRSRRPTVRERPPAATRPCGSRNPSNDIVQAPHLHASRICGTLTLRQRTGLSPLPQETPDRLQRLSLESPARAVHPS